MGKLKKIFFLSKTKVREAGKGDISLSPSHRCVLKMQRKAKNKNKKPNREIQLCPKGKMKNEK